MSPSREKASEADSPVDVETFLRTNPSWLAEHPELYRVLTPPVRFYGDPLADHMAAMLRLERRRSAEMAAHADDVLAAGRAAAGLSHLVQRAVLAIIRSSDPAECIAGEFAAILGIDVAVLCTEEDFPHARRLSSGRIETLLAGRDLVMRADPPDTSMLYAEAARLARRDVLIGVPWRGPKTLLALASRDPDWLDLAHGNMLVFLGQTVGASLERAG